MDRVLEFAGKFHPLLVHLPIGFLLIAVIFIWLKEPGRAVRISIGLGAVAAICSVVTGLLLANSEGYNEEVQLHKWSGIVLMIVSGAMWFIPAAYLKAGSIVMTVLIFLTGHFGGTLTHGPLIAESEADNLDLTKIDLNNAVFYNDAVKPIFEARCVSCHGDIKEKGGLRLDSQEAINKGGKNGKIFVPGNPAESEMVKRIDLPPDDEDHMPPKEKKQLTDQEKKLISFWVASGADFGKKISESLNEKQLAELMVKESEETALPEIEPANEEIIKKLIEQNVAITPVGNQNNFLQVNFISVPGEAEKLLKELNPIAKNVLWLKLNGAKITTIDLNDYVNLTELNLSGTRVDDGVIDQIIKCEQLVKLNLSGTKIESIKKLEALKHLKYLNIYNTSIEVTELPGIKIEKGNYEVPTLESDTTLVKLK
jgi:uncharacterized membrane protein